MPNFTMLIYCFECYYLGPHSYKQLGKIVSIECGHCNYSQRVAAPAELVV